MNTSCVIVEDEQLSIDLLRSCLERVPEMTVAASFTSALEAKRNLGALRPDLLFLDIEMPDLTGLELLRLLDHPIPAIVTSAYDRYALASYEHAVVDYVLKPISPLRLQQAIAKFQRWRPQTPAAPEPDHLVVKDGHALHRIPLQDIRWIESFGEYVRIHARQGILTPLASLASLADRLPKTEFVRIHRQRIVSLRHVAKVDQDGVLVDGMAHPLGRKFRQEFLALLEQRHGATRRAAPHDPHSDTTTFKTAPLPRAR